METEQSPSLTIRGRHAGMFYIHDWFFMAHKLKCDLKRGGSEVKCHRKRINKSNFLSGHISIKGYVNLTLQQAASQNATFYEQMKRYSQILSSNIKRGGKTLLIYFSPVLLPDVTNFMEIVSCRVFGYAAWSLWHKATGKDQTLSSFHFWIFGKVRSQTCYFCHTSARPADQTSERY